MPRTWVLRDWEAVEQNKVVGKARCHMDLVFHVTSALPTGCGVEAIMLILLGLFQYL